MTETITTATARVVEQLTREAVAPLEIEPGLYLAPDAETGSHVIDVRDQIQHTKGHPLRKTGDVTLTQHDSFTAYLAKHALPETELWADIDKDRVVAVINAHGPASGDPDDEGTAGWGDHRATLQLVTTPDWRAWVDNDGKLMAQVDFAEFVEQHLPNFVRPTAADMLELAQTIKGSTKVSWEAGKRVKSGETTLEYREDVSATAGKKGSVEIPDTIDLALQVYEAGAAYRVTARFRYRMSAGGLTLGYVLERAADVKRDAFSGVVNTVASDSGRDVWHGTP